MSKIEGIFRGLKGASRLSDSTSDEQIAHLMNFGVRRMQIVRMDILQYFLGMYLIFGSASIDAQLN